MSDAQTTDDGKTHDEQVQKIAELIKDAHISTLTTVDTDGSLWSRPMGIQAADFAGTLYFFTEASSEKVTHIAANPNVSVAFSDPDDQNYVMMAGTAAVLNDRAKIAELWSEPMRTWFPEGKDDPEIRLIKVDVHRAEYWDSPSSAVVYAYGYVKAVLTGEQPNPGEHAKVSL